ncbi:unnamed protein product [Rhizoctonia solani]|uniref:NACHT domain-containing protein n=1 Tax=Rhizoctonia solani TaxID=456999 RepID=A0A8H3GFZ8_9AGAM|nr:unnamed protein product [Rhizoctonia solani]
MWTVTGTSRSKKGFQGFLRDTFGRSSSRPHTPDSPISSQQHISPASLASDPSATQGTLLSAKEQPVPSPGQSKISTDNDRPQPNPSPDSALSASDVPTIQEPTMERPVIPQSVSTPGVIGIESTESPMANFLRKSEGGSPPTNPLTTPDPSNTRHGIMNIAWAGLKRSLQTLRKHSNSFPSLASAADILLTCLDALETSARSQENYEDLATELTVLGDSLSEYLKNFPGMTKCVAGVALGLQRQAREIESKLSRGTGGKLLFAKEDEEEVIRHYRRIQSLFRQLQTNLGMDNWRIANEHLVNTRLEALKPVKEAIYDSNLSSIVNRRMCTEGTRTEALADLTRWVYDRGAPSIYWMNGMAGTGKTTITYTFSERLEHLELLGASFFCTRATADCRDLTRIIPSIAYQLARYSVPFQSALYDILGREPDIGSKNTQKQFERLIRDPLLTAMDAMPDHIVVVIDALDECDNRNGVENLLDICLRYAAEVPLKFLITSRPEPEIYARMMLDLNSRSALHLHDIAASLVQADIELYLKEELAFVTPTEIQVKQLAHRSGSLFIYAATLVRYIRFGERFTDPRQRLQSVLSLTPESAKQYADIDALYTAILESALKEARMEEHEAEDVRLVLQTVLCAQEPIDAETIAVLSGLDNPQRVNFALRPLRSVLHQFDDTGLVSALHASFPDFVFSNERSKLFFCDPVAHNRLLAQKCFRYLKEQLRFNICDLESSFVADEKVEDLQEQIASKVSPALAYTCRYWPTHLSLAPKSDNLAAKLDDFLSEKFLFWMEVLSLRQEVTEGIGELLKVNKWLNQGGSKSPETTRLVDDARDFLMSHAASPASQSTPHIYISSLPFCPQSSSVYKHYRKRMRGLLNLKGSLIERRGRVALVTYTLKQNSISKALSFSPDGTRVAVGLESIINIHSAYDGKLLAMSTTGHDEAICSVMFSPDSRYVASQCNGGTILVWNALDGSLFAGPFHVRPNYTGPLCFSSDSSCIAVVSNYNAHLLNLTNGTLLLHPVDAASASPIAFAPDGNLFATVSNDRSIRLRYLHNGAIAAYPFEGHITDITSLSFTPDNTRLVSSSDDEIRVWRIPDGSPATKPFGNGARSVSISPDGTRIASTSSEGLKVWKIEDGTLVSGPFGESDYGMVSFSPDGTQIISATDSKVDVWKSQDDLFPPSTPFRNHIYGVKSVSLLGDCNRILSIAADNTLWLWTITPEQILSTPLEWNEGFEYPTYSHRPSNRGDIVGFASNGQIHITDAHGASGTPTTRILEGHTARVAASAFSVDDNVLVTGAEDDDCTVRIWSVRDAKPIMEPLFGHTRSVSSVAVSPDLVRVVSCSYYDETLRVWNTRNPILNVASPMIPPSGIYNSSRIFDGWNQESKDGWVKNGKSALLFWIPPDIASVSFSPHTECIITKDGILQIPQQELLLGNQWSKCYISD